MERTLSESPRLATAMKDWPHNTEILRANGYYSGMWGNPAAAMKRGREVHAAVHILTAGAEIDDAWIQRHQDYLGYILGAQKWLAEHKVELLEKEYLIECKSERYVTTLDQVDVVDGYPAIVEIKTGSRPNAIELQTGGQKRALRLQNSLNATLRMSSALVARFMLLLPGDGTYKFEKFTDPRDEEEFVLLCRGWWVNQRRGLNG